MVRKRYIGFGDPQEKAAQLIPVAKMLREWQATCQPFGGQRLAIGRLSAALEAFTREVTGKPLLHHDDIFGVPGVPKVEEPSIEQWSRQRAADARARDKRIADGKAESERMAKETADHLARAQVVHVDSDKLF